jgi:hypothetical protein
MEDLPLGMEERLTEQGRVLVFIWCFRLIKTAQNQWLESCYL